MNSVPDKPTATLAVFDSGLGGLTVVNELTDRLPQADIVYLGDSARVPYGIKSLETVRQFAVDCATFCRRFEPALTVVACNTASAAAMDDLHALCDGAIVDVIAPAVTDALNATQGPIGVIATEATIASGAYERAIKALEPHREIAATACPLLVPIIEEGRPPDDPIVLAVLGDYLKDLQRRRVGALILGCTHYPLLAEAIGKLMGPEVVLINSGAAAAGAVVARLNGTIPEGTGQLTCYTTGDVDRFAKLAGRFLGRGISTVCHVGTDELTYE